MPFSIRTAAAIGSAVLVLCGTCIGQGNSASTDKVKNKGCYRFPTISGDAVVFTAEGDLWTVSSDGGLATRLTTSLGEEKSAAFSPDGKTLAFSSDYEGRRLHHAAYRWHSSTPNL